MTPAEIEQWWHDVRLAAAFWHRLNERSAAMDNNHEVMLLAIKDYVTKHPEVAAYVADYVAAGIEASRQEALNRAADMETALAVCIAKRYGGRNELILNKLKKWNGRSALRWDSTIAMLEGKERSDDH